MAGFTGAFIREGVNPWSLTHLTRLHNLTALCGADAPCEAVSFRITSSEVGSFLRTLLDREPSPCQRCRDKTFNLG